MDIKAVREATENLINLCAQITKDAEEDKVKLIEIREKISIEIAKCNSKIEALKPLLGIEDTWLCSLEDTLYWKGIMKLYDDGVPLRDLAGLTGTSHETVRQNIIKLGA